MTLSRIFLLAICLLLPGIAHAARTQVSAAVATRSFDTDLRFEDGRLVERQFRRAGVEYREGITKHVSLGFTFGYSENEGRDPERPFETISGNYGSIGLHFDVPVAHAVYLRGRIEYLLQRDRQETDSVDFETRTRESRAEFGPLLRLGAFEFSAGASRRDLDYRETLHEADSDVVRHADAVDDTGGFAAIGLLAGNDGIIALRYDTGMEEGLALRFEKTF